MSKDLSFGPVERVDFVVAFQPENIVALRYSDRQRTAQGLCVPAMDLDEL